jgi:hypothetical protein
VLPRSFYCRILALLIALGSGASGASIGNPLVTTGGLDGYSAIMMVNETDTYTNTSGVSEIVTISQWNVHIGAARGRVTPFVVRVNADDNFTVLAIGTTRIAGTGYTTTGVKTFPFAGGPVQITLNAGETIAAGYSDADPGGTNNAGSVIPFEDGGDEIWLTGGWNSIDAGSVAVGGAPTPAITGTTYNALSRQYQFNIEFTSEPSGPVAPTDLQLAQLDVFPSSSGIVVGTLTTTDLNIGDTFTYAIVTNPAGLFLLTGNVLRLGGHAGALGTNYLVRIRTTDQTGRSLEKDFSIPVIAPFAPSDMRCTAEHLLTGTPLGTTLGRFGTVDANTADAFVYALVSGAGGTENSKFMVQGDTLKLAGTLPAGATSVSFRVRSTDRAGLSVERAFSVPVSGPDVRINEFLANNDTGITDEDGAHSDWIELYNPLAVEVNLAGWHLTDDAALPAQWTFPNVSLAPGGYLRVFASAKNRTPTSGNLHANFSLDGAGEYLALSKPDGTIVDAYGPHDQANDISYGCDASGAGRGYMLPTPGAVNGPAFVYGINKVTFSVPRGFYNAAQSLALTADAPGSLIRYTTDGTKPSATNGFTYTNPIAIAPDTAGTTRGTKRVRAVALNANAAANRVVTHTYLFPNGLAGPSTDGIVSQTNTNNAAQTNAIRANPAYAALLDDGLLALPAIVITNPSGLPSTGESEASVELLSPAGSEAGFHINCGIQAVGNASLASPKNNFRLYFRSEYGETKLNYDLFAGHPYDPHGAVKSFDRLNVRSCSHDTFHWLADPGLPPAPGTPADALYLRNIVMDDLQFLMGKMSTHGRFANCFVNGQYHGLYHIREYPNDDFFASYLPGPDAKFEFTNGANPAENGTPNWQATWNVIRSYATTSGAANYAELKRRIDVTDLADFVVLNFWAGNNWDWNPNQNWMAGGPNVPDAGGWRFFSYDNDIIWMSQTTNVVTRNVPDNWFNSLMSTHPDFQVLFRDRAYKHLLHNGALTNLNARAVLEFRENQIRTAIVGETARWQPGAATFLPWDRDGEWQTELNRMKNTFFPARCAAVLSQLRTNGWYPVDPPEFGVYGGSVPMNYKVTLTAPSGAIYVTVDGTDPRQPGGAIGATAFLYTSPPAGALNVNSIKTVRARAKTATDWSALNLATFTPGTVVAASAANIMITEIHYHPAEVGGQEFIEVMNVGASYADLSGVSFLRGIDYQFPNGTILPPGARIVVTESQFLNGTNLSNNGEKITLVAPNLTMVIRDFSYEESILWPEAADGGGPSLVLKNPSAANATDIYEATPSNWRCSTTPGGNPANSDATVFGGIATDDGDGDGLNALLEYALGTSDSDQRSGSQAYALTPEPENPGNYLFTYQRSTAADDVTISLEESTDLAAWTPVDPLALVSIVESGATTSITHRIAAPPPGDRVFVRLKVVK